MCNNKTRTTFNSVIQQVFFRTLIIISLSVYTQFSDSAEMRL